METDDVRRLNCQLPGGPGGLREWMILIELSGYTDAEKRVIATDHLLPLELAVHRLAADDVHFTDEAVEAIIRGYTRTAGVWGLAGVLGALRGKVVRRRGEGDDALVFASGVGRRGCTMTECQALIPWSPALPLAYSRSRQSRAGCGARGIACAIVAHCGSSDRSPPVLRAFWSSGTGTGLSTAMCSGNWRRSLTRYLFIRQQSGASGVKIT